MLTDPQIIDAARQLIEDVGVGCLVTIGPDQRPYARYMGAVPGDEALNWFYSLSAHATQKVEHLREHAEVCWVFADANYENVATLHGKARIEPTSEMPASVYDRLIEFARPYAVNVLTDPHHHQYEAIITQVETVELLSPEKGLTTPRQVQTP
ncbi:MAG: pyridoxamine 5'-phosphate oxidase family protein [Phycisphaeraceae bacterium]